MSRPALKLPHGDDKDMRRDSDMRRALRRNLRTAQDGGSDKQKTMTAAKVRSAAVKHYSPGANLFVGRHNRRVQEQDLGLFPTHTSRGMRGFRETSPGRGRRRPTPGRSQTEEEIIQELFADPDSEIPVVKTRTSQRIDAELEEVVRVKKRKAALEGKREQVGGGREGGSNGTGGSNGGAGVEVSSRTVERGSDLVGDRGSLVSSIKLEVGEVEAEGERVKQGGGVKQGVGDGGVKQGVGDGGVKESSDGPP